MSYSRAELLEMPPHELLRVIQYKGTEPTVLTFAAEYYGGKVPPEQALSALVPLLKHPKPYVREGAVYGLVPHLNGTEVRAVLLDHRDKETSPGVLEALDEVFEEE